MVKKIACLFVMHLLLFVTIASNLASEPIVLKTKVVFAFEDKNNFPYYLGQGSIVNHDKPGVSVEFLTLLEKRLNLEIDFKRLPWKRCLAELKKGRVDGIFNASFRSERMKLGAYPMTDGRIDHSRRLTTMAYMLYQLKNATITWDSSKKIIHNLKSEICAPRGYSIVGDLKKWKIPVYELNTTQDCFKILASGTGRFSGIATLEPAGDFYLNKYQDLFGDIEKVYPPLIVKEYYLMLSYQFLRRNPLMAEKIWTTIGELRDTEFDQILSSYLQ